MTTDEKIGEPRPSSRVIDSSSVIRHSSFRAPGAFTVIELLIVMSIIIVLAGLILATSGYVQKKGARSRAEAEIAALSAALESYKADNGTYPRSSDTDNLDPSTGNPSAYTNAAAYLTWSLSPAEIIPEPPPPPDQDPYQEIRTQVQGWLSSGAIKEYFNAKDTNLSKPRTSAAITMSVTNPSDPSHQISVPARVYTDPFGNRYGYSTAKATNPTGSVGFNPTFDLWSTGPPAAGGSQNTDPSQWIKNW